MSEKSAEDELADNVGAEPSTDDLIQLDDFLRHVAASVSDDELTRLSEEVGAAGGEFNKHADTLLRLARHFSPSEATADADTIVAGDGFVPPKRIGRFAIERELGSGGFGVVYLAEDTILGRKVALKVPRRDIARDAVLRDRLLHEARAVGHLDHPNIVPIYQAGQIDEMAYVASAYCDGPNLAEWLQHTETATQAHASPTQVAEFTAKLARAVDYAHRQGIVHRDIKPSNVMLMPAERSREDYATIRGDLSRYEPRLCDFGLAKVTAESIADSRSSWIMGTPVYMAPEQLMPGFGPVTEKTDIYALGIVLIELLGIAPPSEGKTYAEILAELQQERYPQNLLSDSKAPRDLQIIVSRSAARFPDDRYESATALADDLEAFTNDLAIHARPFNWASQVKSWARTPSRIQEAWTVCIIVNFAITLWLLYGIRLTFGSDYPGESPAESAFSVASIVLAYHVPMAVLSVLGLRGVRWTLYVATAMSVLFPVGLSLLVLVEVTPVVTPDLYSNAPFFNKLTHAFILAFGLVQSVFLIIAVYADRTVTKQKRLMNRRSQCDS